MTDFRTEPVSYIVQHVSEESKPVGGDGDVQIKFSVSAGNGETFDVTIVGPGRAWSGHFVGAANAVAVSLARTLGGRIGKTEFIDDPSRTS